MRRAARPKVPGYRLGDAFASGTSGPTYAARGSDGTAVAVRLLRVPETERRRLLRRGRALLRRPHAGLAPLREVTELADGGLAVVMELVDGPTLAQLAAVRGGLPGDVVTRLVADVAAALDHLHGGGTVHGDLSPHNVILSTAGAVLVDLLGSPAASTPGFRSPERAAGHPATPASDVWELAALAAWALRGPDASTGIAAGSSFLPRPVADALDLASGPSARRPSAATIAALARTDDELRAGDAWHGALAADLPDLALGAMRAAVLVAPTQRPGEDGRRRRRRLALGGAAALAVIGIGAAITGTGLLEGAAAAAVGSPSPFPAAVDLPDGVLAALAQRDRALGVLDLDALALAVAPGSPAWENDAALVAALAQSGTTAAGLRTTARIGEVAPAASEDHHEVEVHLRQQGHVRLEAGQVRWVAELPERCLVLEVVTVERRVLLRDWSACAGAEGG